MAPTTAAEFANVNPADLNTRANVRTVKIDADFAASIADLGVLTPIVARREDDGTLTILFGHRRTAALGLADHRPLRGQVGIEVLCREHRVHHAARGGDAVEVAHQPRGAQTGVVAADHRVTLVEPV